MNRKEVFLTAEWICPAEWVSIAPKNILHKECVPSAIPTGELPDQQRYAFRKVFFCERLPESCTLRITADDYYKLYLNGRYVCQGPAQGYAFSYYWNEVELAPYLQPGANTLTAEVYYHGRICRSYQSGDDRMGLIAEAVAEGRCLFSTDESWECGLIRAYTGDRTVGYDTQFLENYDSRLETVVYAPASVKVMDYTYADAPAKLLQTYELAPIASETLADGGIFYDFGHELTGSLRLRATGKAGQRIRILCGEEMADIPEKTRFDMRCNCRYEEWWTLAEGENTWMQYDYKAFRYVTLVPDDGVKVNACTVMVRHYPFDDDFCRLETDDEVLAAVFEICKNGVKYGAQETFTDCPQREKGQYAGDLTISGASQSLLTGDLSLLRKAIDNQMQSAAVCPGLLAVTPGSQMQEIADYSLQFPLLALRHYAYSGDREYLRQTLAVCEGILRHFAQFARPDGLIEHVWDKWNLVDWPEGCRDGYDFPLTNPVGTGCHNVINAFYIGCTMQTEQIREILGQPQPKHSPALIEAFYRTFYRPQTGLFADAEGSRHSSLHANILPLFYGFAHPEDAERLADFLEEKGLCCGVYVAWFLLKALCRAGRETAAYRLITSTGENSWYNMVREGGTTCFEAFGKEQKWNTSLCHPWASGPISVLIEDILPRHPEYGRIVWKDPARMQRKDRTVTV